jgi:beta propeller repeat protein
MNERSRRKYGLIRRLPILVIVVLIFPILVLPHSGRAGLADLPYRLVPGMTSSVGVELTSLATSESLIVWEDHRGGGPDIYAHDINDGREFRASRTADQRRRPAVSGSVIVWVSGESPLYSTIRGIDLAEGVEFAISDEPAFVDRPAVSAHLFTWQERRDGQWVVRVIHRDTGDVTTLSESANNAGRPSVSGRLLAWQEHDGDSWNIKLYDSVTGSTSRLTDGVNDDQYPVLSDGQVAFVRTSVSGGSPELIVLDIESGREQAIVSDHYIAKPAVHGDIVVWEDWRSGLPDIYAYDLAHEESFAVARSQQATAPVVSDHIITWISGSNPMSQRVQMLEIQQRLPTDPQDPPAVPSPDRLYVQETQHFVSSGFKAYWQAHGGPQVLGFPLTEEFAEVDPETGDEITVQYFERVKLEFHPNAPEDSRVRLARLGFYLRPEREADPVEPFESDESRRYFEETGHAISHGFKEFWETNGGLALFGYPLTGEFLENGRTVQYFERARFEFDPEAGDGGDIRLGLLGREALQDRGWLPLPPIDTTQIFE